MNRQQKQVYKQFIDDTKEKYVTAGKFQIFDLAEPELKRIKKNELFEFQHVGIEYCICGHDQGICHPQKDICLNRKCTCLQYSPSKHNNQLDMTKPITYITPQMDNSKEKM